MRARPALAILFLVLAAPALANAVELKPVTLEAWNGYVNAARKRMEERASGRTPFLWVDEGGDRAHRVRTGEVLAEPLDGSSPHAVPHGLIHGWIGAMFIPKATLDDVMGVLDDYKRYTDIYKPMVVKAALIEATDDHKKVGLLLVQKALYVTGAVQTDDEVRTARLGADRVYTLSASVHVQEVADYGEPSQHALPEDHGPGYVWRTFNVTRLEERDDGVYVELEMLAMSRSIPLLFRWLVEPLAERLPRSMLVATLEDTRNAVSQKIIAASSKSQSAAHRAAPQ